MIKTIKKLFKDHRHEFWQWIISNLFIPISIILLTLGLVYFRDDLQFSTAFYATLFNGSLPLTAINILVVGFYLILMHSKNKEDDLNLHLSHSRFVLVSILIVALITSVIFYITQSLYTFSPETHVVKFWIQIVSSVLLIILSLGVSSIFFLFTEDKILRSFGGLDYNEEKDINSNKLMGNLLCKQNRA